MIYLGLFQSNSIELSQLDTGMQRGTYQCHRSSENMNSGHYAKTKNGEKDCKMISEKKGNKTRERLRSDDTSHMDHIRGEIPT